MNHDQAKQLGLALRQRRIELDMSTPQLARASGQKQATVVRIEQGQFLTPDPEKLRALAEALELNLADVLSMAGYPIPTELPSVGPYLRTKYRDLPPEAVDEVQAEVSRVLRKHGIEPGTGPRDGEDEQPESASPEHDTATNELKGGSP